MKQKGVLTVISGFSGVGKGTLVRELLSAHSEYALSISATTRSPRPGEEHGREYFFLSPEQFQEMIRQDQLIEYASYCDNYYGTPRSYVEEQMAAGKDMILEIDIQGGYHIKEQYPDAVLIFVVPPDAGTLVTRLRGRGSETEEVIARRLARAAEEAGLIADYDYILVNDDLQESTQRLHELIQSQHCRREENKELIDQVCSELSEYVKGEF